MTQNSDLFRVTGSMGNDVNILFKAQEFINMVVSQN